MPQAITVSFATVTQPGLLTADAMAAPAPPPAGFRFAGAGVVDIVTTALVAPPIEVCLQGVGFTALDRVLHYEAGAWLDVTTSSTPTKVCATVASLSPFAVITIANHAPTANAGAPQTVEATSAAGASVTLTGTGADPDGDTLSFRWTEGTVEVGTTATVTAPLPIGSHALALTVSDGQESATSTTLATVRDTVAPAITVPANTTIEATSAAGAAHTYVASATDVVDGAVATTCAPASGSTFPFGATTVTCMATDSHANHATKTFTVTVTDTTAPVITVPANATVEATGSTGATFTYTASATDTLDGPITPTCAPASGSPFSFGATTVTCTANDSHANVATKTFAVTVTDTTAPVLTVPANATVEATAPTGAPLTFTVSATDALDGSVTPTCAPASGSIFRFGATTVTCTAADSHGNIVTRAFTVTVTDTTAPLLTVPPNATVEATGPAGAPFSDGCRGDCTRQ